MPTHDPAFVDWANRMTHTNGSWEEEVGARLGMQGMINAIVNLPPDLQTRDDIRDHAIGWVSNEITHSGGHITDEQPKAVFDAAEYFIRTTLE